MKGHGKFSIFGTVDVNKRDLNGLLLLDDKGGGAVINTVEDTVVALKCPSQGGFTRCKKLQRSTDFASRTLGHFNPLTF